MKYKNNGQWEEITIKALDSMPIGSIILFAGETIPNGWLICDGDAVASATYPDLYSVIGTKYGGNSTNFNLPSFRGRVGVGVNLADEDFDTVGNSGGSKFLQAHNHGGYTKTNIAYNTTGIYTTGGSSNFYVLNWGGSKVGNDSSYSDKTNHRHVINTDGTGDGENMPPYLVVNYIIKALNTTPTMASVVNQRNASTEDTYSCNFINGIGYHLEYTRIGSANNSSPTYDMTTDNDKLSNYDFLYLVGGYGYNKSSTMAPVSAVSLMGSSFAQMRIYVTTYNSTGWISINYISDTSFKINCSIGTDTSAALYGVKIVQNSNNS